MANVRIKDLSTTAATTASDDFFGVDGATNGTRKLDAYSPTFGGNLTVSGGTITGGTSGLSLAAGGTNQDITLTPSGTGKILLKLGDVDSQVNVYKRSTADIAFIGGNAAGSVARSLYFQGASVQFGIGGVGEVGRFAATTGNLLLGTSTDSGNGKLQLATHTTSAGGIGFGTDTQLFTTGSGLVSLTSSTTWPTLKISDTGTGTYTTGVLAFGDGNSSARNVGIWRGASNSIVATGNVLNLGGYAGITFTTGGAQIGSQTTALTLDSSQNATFAGVVVVGGGNASSGTLAVNYSSAVREPIAIVNSAVGGKYWYIGDGTGTSNGTFGIRSGSDSKTVFTITGAGNATFAGTITANGASVVSTLSASGTTVTGFDVTNSAAAAVNNATRVIFRNNSAFSGSFVSGEIKSVTPAANNTSNLVFSAYEKDNGLLTALTLTPSGTSVSAAFNGAISINNTVQTAVAVASTHKVTISIGGVTYYLLATNV